MRIVISGAPKTGKTTLAKELATPHVARLHTDDLIASHDWSEASQAVSEWFDRYKGFSFVIEGVAVPRALRKWLARNPEGKPCDVAIVLSKPHVEQTKAQLAMGKGVDKVWQEILPELIKRGVKIENK